MMVYNKFDAQHLLFICLQISPQIFAILQNFAMDNLRDQQFCTLLCELERPVVVLFTGLALEVEVSPGMVWTIILTCALCIIKRANRIHHIALLIIHAARVLHRARGGWK